MAHTFQLTLDSFRSDRLARSDSNETIRAGRRRPSGESGPRERADAPERRQTGGSGGGGFGGGGSGSNRPSGGFTSGGRPAKGGCLSSVLGLIVVIVAVIIFGPSILSGETPTADQAPAYQEEPTQAVVQRPTRTPAPTRPRPTASSGSGESWLVMLYQDADDKILEQDIYIDLNEAERFGSTGQVKVVAQIDRFQGGYAGDGNWTEARRYVINRDDDLNYLASDEVDSLGEVNMADAATLVDFVTWAVETYPADKYALILSDHGMGWPGGWSDGDSRAGGGSDTPLQSAAGDHLFLNELDQALGQIRSQVNLDKFELIGMDACLMGQLEVLAPLAQHARYAVLSEETEPALGWAYTRILEALNENPQMDGAELGKVIVDSYIIDDQRIIDEQAREAMLRQGSGMSGLFGAPPRVSARQLADQFSADITLSAVDLSQVPALMQQVNNLAYRLQSVDQNAVARARNFSRAYTSVFGSDTRPSYLDLGNFVELLANESGDAAVKQAAQQVRAAIDQAVLANTAGPKRSGSTGISIYFPNSTLYRSPVAGPQSYTGIASRFASESLWDDFLAFHYTDRMFRADDAAPVVPSGGSAVRGPGAEPISISNLRLVGAQTAAPGSPVLLSAQISGKNIGYIYLFAGYLDRASNSIFIADMDYLESPNTREIEGVYYPVWSARGSFNLEFEWEPLMFAISDGSKQTLALLRPEIYGATPEEAFYSVDGIYTYADGGEQRYARLYFADGSLRRVYGFTGEDGSGSPREIIPNPGDSFTVLEQWLDPGAQGEPMQAASQSGETLTFNNTNFTWKELDAAAGDYIVGFIVEDLDGNRYEAHVPVTVR